MLQQETLKENDDGLYEEPDGEFLELIEQHRNSIAVLTRVNIENAAESPINPEGFTVSEIQEYVESNSLSDGQTAALLEAEQQGKNRKTAKDAINDN